jgi:hypothetical protein
VVVEMVHARLLAAAAVFGGELRALGVVVREVVVVVDRDHGHRRGDARERGPRLQLRVHAGDGSRV